MPYLLLPPVTHASVNPATDQQQWLASGQDPAATAMIVNMIASLMKIHPRIAGETIIRDCGRGAELEPPLANSVHKPIVNHAMASKEN